MEQPHLRPAKGSESIFTPGVVTAIALFLAPHSHDQNSEMP